jgi:16S rRNA G966 N2-methylase RsmD
LKKNIDAVLKSASLAKTSASVVNVDVLSWIESADLEREIDIVFVDPPYPIVEGIYQRVIAGLSRMLNPAGATILFESPFEFEELPECYRMRKTYGKGREDSRCMLIDYLGK